MRCAAVYVRHWKNRSSLLFETSTTAKREFSPKHASSVTIPTVRNFTRSQRGSHSTEFTAAQITAAADSHSKQDAGLEKKVRNISIISVEGVGFQLFSFLVTVRGVPDFEKLSVSTSGGMTNHFNFRL
jgi:hypothetical protein